MNNYKYVFIHHQGHIFVLGWLYKFCNSYLHHVKGSRSKPANSIKRERVVAFMNKSLTFTMFFRCRKRTVSEHTSHSIYCWRVLRDSVFISHLRLFTASPAELDIVPHFGVEKWKIPGYVFSSLSQWFFGILIFIHTEV